MPLHVLQLGPYPPPEGGICRNMLAIRDEIVGIGRRCSIVATSRSSQIDEEADVYHPRSTLGLLKLLASLKFDILHLHIGGDVSPRVLALALVCSLFGRKKSVLTLHSGEYPLTKEARSASANSLRGLIFRRFSRIIAVNEAIAEVFQRYGVDNERIKVILPFALKVPDENISVPKEFSDFRAKHSPFLLSVGGLEKDYDPLFQIAAMKDILAEFPNAALMIAGDGSMRSEVEKAVEMCDYRDNISLPGSVEHDVTLHLINDADVLLRTTLFDGDAISVREALFLKTPVIATDNGMRPAGVRLMEIGDTKTLVEILKELASAGKENCGNGESDNSNITAVVKVYEELA